MNKLKATKLFRRVYHEHLVTSATSAPPVGANSSEHSPMTTITCMGTEANTSANLVVRDSFERSASPQMSETEHDCSSGHDKNWYSQVLSLENQKIHCHRTHRDESFDHITMKWQELRPPDIGSTKISDVITGETGFVHKGPDPAPPQPWIALFPDHY